MLRKTYDETHTGPQVTQARGHLVPHAVPQRRVYGRPFVAGDAAAKAAASAGGKAKRAHGALALATVGSGIADAPAFKPYRRKAGALRRALCAEVAEAAAGMCGAVPSALLGEASLYLAASRYVFDMAAQSGTTALFAEAVKLSAQARQHILAAWELAIREAKILRLDGDGPVDADALMRKAEERTRARVVEGG